MRKILFAQMLALCFSIAHSQKRFEIQGNIESDKILIKLSFSEDQFSAIETKPKNNKFKIAGKIDEPYEFVSLAMIKDGEYITEMKFFVSPARHQISIIWDKARGKYIFKSKTLPFINELASYDSLMEISRKKRSIITAALSREVKANSTQQDSLELILKKLNDTILYKKMAFIGVSKGVFPGIFFFKRDIVNDINSQIRLTPDSMYKVFSGFNNNLKNTRTGKWIEEELQKRLNLTLGRKMPAFTFSDTSFNIYTLKNTDMKKAMLLCFWDAGCRPCISSFPMLKSLYREHNSLLDIVSVSLDTDESRWKNALKKYSLPWPNTCNLKKYTTMDIAALYNIQYIPQYFLINKSGQLIYHNVFSNDDDDYNKLRQKMEGIFADDK